MRPSNGLTALARGLVPFAAMLASTLIPSGQAQAQSRSDAMVKVLVPAYFYPTWWAGSPWDDLNRAAAKVPIQAIMNPASGPGDAPNADYLKAVADLHAAGGKVIGYVSTAYGTRPFEDVARDVDSYLAWYDVDGIFLDEMGNQFGGTDYTSIYNYIKANEAALGRELHVVGNAGMPFPQVEVYLQAADTLVIFEGPQDNTDPWGASFDAYPTAGPYAYAGLPLWFLNYRPKQLANLVYGVPTADAMRAALSKAVRYNAGYVYLTDDDNSAWNPWDSLPSYWDQEVDAIAAINAARK